MYALGILRVKTMDDKLMYVQCTTNQMMINKSPLANQSRFNKSTGSREEDEVAGFFVFSHIRMGGYLRLG